MHCFARDFGLIRLSQESIVSSDMASHNDVSTSNRFPFLHAFTAQEVTSAVRCRDAFGITSASPAPSGSAAEGWSVSVCVRIRSVVQNGRVVHERVKCVRDDCLATVPGGPRPQRGSSWFRHIH